ncbi:MAG: hypothetical protein ABI839_02285 [Verrucomicrobiota bacterium]
MAKRIMVLILPFLLAFAAPAATAPRGEWVLLVGGVSMNQWEKYKTQPHDHWWANFVHAARIRTEQLRAQYGPDLPITWLVYKPAYLERSKQDGRDLIELINSVRDKYNLHLVYFNKGGDVVDYLNNGRPRNDLKVAGFEYFGHSNKACFMFDYSNVIDSSAKAWLHQTDFVKINRNVFARDAYVKSWGCHSGEMMSDYWRKATGLHMWGAVGKTQYMSEELPVLVSPTDKWVN